jgi:hypothetical protein
VWYSNDMTTNNEMNFSEISDLLTKANKKCASAHSDWLRSTLDTDTLGRKEAFAEYKRCQDESFRISKMARLLKK